MSGRTRPAWAAPVWAAPLRARWQALAPRERGALRLVAAVIAAYAAWALLLAPAVQTLRSAPAELARLDAQRLQMQALAVEARTLRAAPPLPPAQAQAALAAATQRLGEAARLSQAGAQATVTLSGVDALQLRDWLAEVRAGARAQPLRVELTRDARGWSGSVVLALPAAQP